MVNTSEPGDPDLAAAALTRLLAHCSDEDSRLAAVENALERLRVAASGLVGGGGYRALLLRAASLGERSAPALRGLPLGPGGTFAPGDAAALVAREGAGVVVGAVSALIREVIVLLTMFIGNELVERLLRRAWPEAYASTAPLASEGKDP